MIRCNARQIDTPSIEELFNKTDRYKGISLFSAATGKDNEITGLNPVIIITENKLIKGGQHTEITEPLEELDNLINQYSSLPEEISILGFISYDYKDRFEEKKIYNPRKQNIYPDFYFAVFEHYIISERKSGSATLLSLSFPFEYNSIEYTEEPVTNSKPAKGSTIYKGTSLDKTEYKSAVRKTADYIKKGDIYQANITRAIYGKTTFSPVQAALRLYNSNRITYGVFASIPGGHVISTSPELFFKTQNGNILASPIKGTIARSDNMGKDNSNKNELLESDKNNAELAMIVDLLRNDISTVSVPGTVKVPKFPILMTLENVYHLYADIKGKLLPGITIGGILKKTFPGGSITGCPKIRSCQIIDELEKTPRGIYTGSFGKISFNGNSIFNIMIRSLFQQESSIIFNVGGGITILSDPEEEYEETIHKGRNIWKAINMENIQEEQFCTGEK